MESETTDDYIDPLGIELSDLMVHSNNCIQIPAEDRHRYDLKECYVDAAVGVGDRSFPLADAWVNDKGKICIPKKNRRIYGVDKGDRLDLMIEGVTHRE